MYLGTRVPKVLCVGLYLYLGIWNVAVPKVCPTLGIALQPIPIPRYSKKSYTQGTLPYGKCASGEVIFGTVCVQPSHVFLWFKVVVQYI